MLSWKSCVLAAGHGNRKPDALRTTTAISRERFNSSNYPWRQEHGFGTPSVAPSMKVAVAMSNEFFTLELSFESASPRQK